MTVHPVQNKSGRKQMRICVGL